MQFKAAEIPGIWIIDLDRKEDDRGFFARTWCREEFAAHGLETNVVQTSISFNARRGTLRGMHYQIAPHEETKVIRCARGAIYDVLVDLRPKSSTFKKWIAVELTQENQRELYVPGGIAHGFQTLVDSTEVSYQMSEVYHPESARGIRWNDPQLNIPWPIANPISSPRDQQLPFLSS